MSHPGWKSVRSPFARLIVPCLVSFSFRVGFSLGFLLVSFFLLFRFLGFFLFTELLSQMFSSKYGSFI